MPTGKVAAAAALAAAAKTTVNRCGSGIEDNANHDGTQRSVMLRLFQKLLTDKELTPPDDWDPPIGYSRNTWGNIVHNKV